VMVPSLTSLRLRVLSTWKGRIFSAADRRSVSNCSLVHVSRGVRRDERRGAEGEGRVGARGKGPCTVFDEGLKGLVWLGLAFRSQDPGEEY